MEELLEMITWSQLGIHKKPVIRRSLILFFPCKIKRERERERERGKLTSQHKNDLFASYITIHVSSEWHCIGKKCKILLEWQFHERILDEVNNNILIRHYSTQVGLLNVDGYYNFLLALFDNGVKEGFIKPGARHIVVSAPTAKELLVKMEVLPQPNQCLFTYLVVQLCLIYSKLKKDQKRDMKGKIGFK